MLHFTSTHVLRRTEATAQRRLRRVGLVLVFEPMPIAETRNLTKTYRMGPAEVHALRNISVAFDAGDYAAVMGPSGSGKSTLLNLLGCLDKPTAGEYYLGPENVAELADDELSLIRSRRIGFIFQSYNLIPQLSVIENVELPLYYQGLGEADSKAAAVEMVIRVGLADRIHHRPAELSGGEQQRVAIARALVSDPLILLADEPTGNLDSATGQEILVLLNELNVAGKTIIMVTHDDYVAACSRRIIRLADGRVVEDTPQGQS